MAIEQGIVIKAHGPAPATARVKTVMPSACEACSSRDQCSSGTGGNEREVDAINIANAKTGDLIQISMDTSALLKATFLLYLFPIICMLGGGIAGNTFGISLGADPSLISASAAVICFAAAMLFVRTQAGRMALKLEYRPKITRILSPGNATASPPSPNACGLQAAGND